MSFDDLFGRHATNSSGNASGALAQESAEIQRTLGASSAASRNVQGAQKALELMRLLPDGDVSSVWNGLDAHQKQQLELQLLKEKGSWHNSSEDQTGRSSKLRQDQFTTVAEAGKLSVGNTAEQVINQGLQADIYKFTERNSFTAGSPYANAPGNAEKIFQSHANNVITNLNESEMQHEFNGNTHSEQYYRHPSLVVRGGPLLNGDNLIKP